MKNTERYFLTSVFLLDQVCKHRQAQIDAEPEPGTMAADTLQREREVKFMEDVRKYKEEGNESFKKYSEGGSPSHGTVFLCACCPILSSMLAYEGM